MKTVLVTSTQELKDALKGNASEILIKDEKLAGQLRLIRRLVKASPLAIGAVIASIALIPATGGTSAAVTAMYVTGAGAAAGGTSAAGIGIGALCVAIGGTVLIALFTDWEHVEIGGILKLKRKAKS
jgi:hypothetical protein